MLFNYDKLDDAAFLTFWGTMRKFKFQFFIQFIYMSWGILLFCLLFNSAFNSFNPISIQEIGIGMTVFTISGIVMAAVSYKKNEKRFHEPLTSNTRVF